MSDKPQFKSKVIAFKGARLAFERCYEPVARTNRDGTPKMRKNKATGQLEPDLRFSATILLDPSNKEHAVTIAEMKGEVGRAADFKFGVGNWSVNMPNFHVPVGLGNDLPKQGKKLYVGFENMFYLKLTAQDKDRPHILNRAGSPTRPGDEQAVFSGCYVAGTTTFYPYDNESRGVGANLRTLVYMREGEAFGGGRVDAAAEYAALGLDAGGDSFVESPGGIAVPASDPFAIS